MSIPRQLIVALSLCAAVAVPNLAIAAQISSYTHENPTNGVGTTLDEYLPGRFQLIYGNFYLCYDSTCEAEYQNPNPPDATIFDIEITGSMSQTFILDSGPNYAAAVALATNGNLDQMNWNLQYSDTSETTTIEWKEDNYYGSYGDLSGFDISYFELIMNVTIDSGLDPVWINHNEVWTFNVYGEQVSNVPIPPSLFLFGSGLLGMIGMARSNLSQSNNSARADSTRKCNSTVRKGGQAAVASWPFVPARMRSTDESPHAAYPRATIPNLRADESRA